MGLFDKTTEKKVELPMASETVDTVIGPDNVFCGGDFKATGKTILSGTLYCRVELEGDLIMQEGSVVIGDVYSHRLMVSGILKGDVKCKELIITKTGVVHGTIKCESMTVHEGGSVDGYCCSNPERQLEVESVGEKFKFTSKPLEREELAEDSWEGVHEDVHTEKEKEGSGIGTAVKREKKKKEADDKSDDK